VRAVPLRSYIRMTHSGCNYRDLLMHIYAANLLVKKSCYLSRSEYTAYDRRRKRWLRQSLQLYKFEPINDRYHMHIGDLRSFEIRFEFESAVPIRFDSKVMGRLKNVRLSRACPLLVVVKRLALSGAVYRLASSMSDHTPVLFNVFENCKEESVVLHISFCFICNSTK